MRCPVSDGVSRIVSPLRIVAAVTVIIALVEVYWISSLFENKIRMHSSWKS